MNYHVSCCSMLQAVPSVIHFNQPLFVPDVLPAIIWIPAFKGKFTLYIFLEYGNRRLLQKLARYVPVVSGTEAMRLHVSTVTDVVLCCVGFSYWLAHIASWDICVKSNLFSTHSVAANDPGSWSSGTPWRPVLSWCCGACAVCFLSLRVLKWNWCRAALLNVTVWLC